MSPSSCFMLPASLKTKLALSTSMATVGMLEVVTPGGECTWFDAVVLNAYKERSALVQEDRDDTSAAFPQHLDFLPRHPTPTAPNEHGRSESVQSFYCYQGPLSPGNLMSKFIRCSHPFFLIYINSFTSQRNRRHPQPIIPAPVMLPTPYDVLHLALSLSRPILVHSFIHLHRRPSSAKFEDQPKYARSRTSPFALLYLASGCSKLW